MGGLFTLARTKAGRRSARRRARLGCGQPRVTCGASHEEQGPGIPTAHDAICEKRQAAPRRPHRLPVSNFGAMPYGDRWTSTGMPPSDTNRHRINRAWHRWGQAVRGSRPGTHLLAEPTAAGRLPTATHAFPDPTSQLCADTQLPPTRRGGLVVGGVAVSLWPRAQGNLDRRHRDHRAPPLLGLPPTRRTDAVLTARLRGRRRPTTPDRPCHLAPTDATLVAEPRRLRRRPQPRRRITGTASAMVRLGSSARPR